jgi:ABC-type antimicrobial peptide transport system permease subunit
VVGVACAAASAKVIESYLYGFPARQPGLFAVLGVVLIAIVTFAAYVPARRAMRIDPMVALRSD